jgi:hypothetical protein
MSISYATDACKVIVYETVNGCNSPYEILEWNQQLKSSALFLFNFLLSLSALPQLSSKVDRIYGL